MKIDLTRRYESPDDFFNLDGSVKMKVSADAAIAICERAIEHGLFISRIEGGFWHSPGFEARLDSIWDGANMPVDRKAATKNNHAAAEFVRSERVLHDVFIITSKRITG
jgi:hypothetical protein